MTRLDRWIGVVLTVSAAVMAAAMVKREFFSTPSLAPGATPSREPEFHAGWTELLKAGIELGDSDAPIKLVEFSDLECPFCRRFHLEVLPAIIERFPGQVSPVFVHFPLGQHRFAAPAAHAAECAAEQDGFARFVGAVFYKQDSLGLRPWTAFASDAGLRDTSRFRACVTNRSPATRIDAGKQAAGRLGVRGTPGIMVNGWLFDAPPSEARLLTLIEELLHRIRTSVDR